MIRARFGFPLSYVVHRSLVSLQLTLSPVMVFSIWIEDPLAIPMDGLQRSRPGKEHRVVLLRRPGEVVRRGKHARMVVLCLRDRLCQILDRLPQRRQCRAVVQYDRLVKALRPALRSSRQGRLTELVLRR
jgi:hypothetical protein